VDRDVPIAISSATNRAGTARSTCLRLELRKLIAIPPTDKENPARQRVFDTSLYAVSFDPSAFGLRGIGILPMMSSDHGQDARATFRQNQCRTRKGLRRKRSDANVLLLFDD
jgi:hypothetical protein